MASYRMGMYALITSLAFTGLTQAATNNAVELQFEPAGDILEGDILIITCRVTGKGHFDVVRLERKFEGSVALISTNQFIDDAFSSEGRYRNVGYHSEGDVTTIVTEISDVEGADGGTIGCSLLPQDVSAEEEINIFVRPKEVQLLHQNDEGEWIEPVDGAVTIKQGSLSGVMCKVVVDGTSAPADIRITMDNNDVAHMFEDEETFDQMMKDGYKHVVRSTDYKYMTDEADIDNHGKILRCSAELPEFPPVIDEAQLEVRYQPRLDCDSHWSAKIGSRNVRIVCRGNMYPAPVFTSWSYGKRPNRTVLHVGESHDNLTAEQQDLGDSTYEFSLAISEVTPNHFRKYRLEVDNGVGSSTDASIRFHEEGYKWNTGSPNAVLPSCITLLLVGFLSSQVGQ